MGVIQRLVGGIIGLEMGTVYSTLGARLDLVEMLDGPMQGADCDLVKIWQKMNTKSFDNVMLKTKTVSARALPEGIEVTFAAMVYTTRSSRCEAKITRRSGGAARQTVSG